MKTRIYKSGRYWVVRSRDLTYVFYLFETALYFVRRDMNGVSPVPYWLAHTLEPARA